MIYGIGTDICDVRRIRASVERHGDRFAQKILSDAELATWRARSERWPERGCWTSVICPRPPYEMRAPAMRS